MRSRTRLFLIASAATLLASCASTDDRSTLAPGNQGTMVNDAEYIAGVENMAARRGVKVEWVNPPKVRTGDD